MNERKLTQKGYQYIFQQQIHQCLLREVGTGLMFKADAKEGRQWVVLGVT